MTFDKEAIARAEKARADKQERVRFLNYIRSGVRDRKLYGKADVFLVFQHLNKTSLIRRGTVQRIAKHKPLTPTQFYAFL